MILTLCGLNCLVHQTAYAQQIQLGPNLYLRETSEPNEFYTVFPNINRVARYGDRELMNDILDAEDEGDWAKLDRLLSLYIKSFGVENFRAENELDLVWRLGQLKQARKDTGAAIFYYSLALKNQSKYYSQVKLSYDSLTASRTNRFVQLDYYYEIVAARRKIDTLIPPPGVMLAMGKKINSPAPDYAPSMHPKGTPLIFTSRRNTYEAISPDFSQNEDLYYVQQSIFGEGWEYAQRFEDIINSQYNEGSACLNADATELIFTRCNAPDGMGVCDLYVAEWKEGSWRNVRPLGPNVNSQDWDSHPNLSADGKTLFFASNRSGGFGKTDIYYCRRREDGQWGPAQNIGPIVNTIEDEVTPFLHPINNTLYFSSKGHVHGQGGFDIYKSRWLLNHWEEPRNLGPLVNTPGDEYYFSIDGKAENLYYAMATEADTRNLDLYSFPMPMNARPDAVVKLSGYLIDSISGHPITGIIQAIDMERGVEVAPIHINDNGYFEFRLIGNRTYRLLILGDNSVTIDERLHLKADTLARIFSSALDLSKPIVFRSMQFRRNSSEIEPQVEAQIREIGEFLRRHPYCRLTIGGHTDSDGDDGFNLTLSAQRAMNIRDLILARSKVKEEQVKAIGYGETRPIFTNDTPEHKTANRRVEFELWVPPAYRDSLKGETLVRLDRGGPAVDSSKVVRRTAPVVVPDSAATASTGAGRKPAAATSAADTGDDLLGDDDFGDLEDEFGLEDDMEAEFDDLGAIDVTELSLLLGEVMEEEDAAKAAEEEKKAKEAEGAPLDLDGDDDDDDGDDR